MKLARFVFATLAAAVLPTAMAQKWEFGAGAGGGFYTSQTISNAGTSADAKLKSNVAVNASLTNNTSGHWGGELGYTYQLGDLQLKQGSSEAVFGAETHSITYSFLYYTRTTESTVRPFISLGAGVKDYKGTGTEQPFQPLSKFALLSKTSDLTPVVGIGVGVKVKIAPHALLRFDVHDYMSTFPKQVIVPNVGSNVEGWVHDIVPMIGLSFTN